MVLQEGLTAERRQGGGARQATAGPPGGAAGARGAGGCLHLTAPPRSQHHTHCTAERHDTTRHSYDRAQDTHRTRPVPTLCGTGGLALPGMPWLWGGALGVRGAGGRSLARTGPGRGWGGRRGEAAGGRRRRRSHRRARLSPPYRIETPRVLTHDTMPPHPISRSFNSQ